MSVFVKIRIIHKLQLTKMSEIYTLCVLRRHILQVVKSARAERPVQNVIPLCGSGTS